jgi:hypothetical protein
LIYAKTDLSRLRTFVDETFPEQAQGERSSPTP